MKKFAPAVFAAAFGIYLYATAPALAPYRDMGEFVAVCHTLGVAHPPGYPLYALVGKIADKIPLANHSYRLSLLSAASGAAACALLFLILLELEVPVFACVLACVLWMSSSAFGIISLVTEMYSMNLAAGMLLLYLWLLWERLDETRLVILLAFLGGILLGVRPDILLVGPAIALLTFSRIWKQKRSQFFSIISWSSLFFALGFSVFLYLLIRSNLKPYLNWNRPETFERLWGSLMRKSHGGTLDLLSQSYAAGELFWTDMMIYFNQILSETFFTALILAPLGLYGLWKTHRRVFYFTMLAWLFTGPFFIYKANLPPNPHALAVLEAHFNLSKAFVYVWMGCGLSFVFGMIYPGILKRTVFALAFPIAIFGMIYSVQSYSKRHNYFGYDYGRNMLKTLPPHSILVLKKDVQLFVFWALQYAEGMRRDVSVVAQGLSGSPWYMQNKIEEGFPVKLGPLKSGDDFDRLMRENPGKPVFVGWEQDLPNSPLFVQRPTGLSRQLVPSGMKFNISVGPNYLKDFYVYRGNYHYEDQKEFFSSDLIDDYSKAHYARAVQLAKDPETRKEASVEWNHSIALHTENPNPYYRRGFLYFETGDFEIALKYFNLADTFYQKTVEQTKIYHSLPDVVDGIKSEWAQVLLNKGVVLEKLGRRDESEGAYMNALAIVPGLAQAHYNIAVLHWNRDWDKVVSHLTRTLAIDPNHALARQFYDKARYAEAMSRQGAR